VVFGEHIVGFTTSHVQVSLDTAMSAGAPEITLLNRSLGEYLVQIPEISGEGFVNVTVNPVADLAGNLATGPNASQTVSIIRDITPATLNLTSQNGTYVSSSFRVLVQSSEPIVSFDDSAILLSISQGRGAAAHTAVQSLSPDNTSFEFTVQDIHRAVDDNGTYSPSMTVLIQVKEGSLSDRAGNPSPAQNHSVQLSVVVNLTGVASITEPFHPAPVVLSDQVQKVGNISLKALIAIVCSLGGVLVCCVILVCLKRRKEANEAPDAFKKYGRQVYAEYGAPATPAGLTLEQIVQYGIANDYDEQRSRVAAQRLMKAADTDNDGLLSEDEFVAWLKKVIHERNKAKAKQLQGQDRRITHKDLRTLKKDFPLKGPKAVKPKSKVGVEGSPMTDKPAVPGAKETDPMLAREHEGPVEVHV